MSSKRESERRGLVPSGLLLSAAFQSKQAVAALNFYNAETLLAHVRAANDADVSIILQTTESTINYLGLEMIMGMAKAAADVMQKPTALHLDHGDSYELAARCLEAGYTSVMFDGSKLPFAKNCAETSRVVKLARSYGASVEGELGHVAHNADEVSIDRFFTDPKDAVQFVNETEVDALAVAVGTAHGFYKGEVKLDFERLSQIREVVDKRVALVLHGGSGVPDALLKRAVACGITKINFGTELKNAFTNAVKKALMSTDEIDLRKTFAPAIEAVQQTSAAKIAICRST